MVIMEMDMDMAWPEAAFQACTAEKCAQEVQNWLQRSPMVANMVLRDAVELFYKEPIDMRLCMDFADLGPLNLFAIVACNELRTHSLNLGPNALTTWMPADFHSSVFLRQNSFAARDCSAIHTALSNWKMVWEAYSSQVSNHPPHAMVPRDQAIPGLNMWKRIGFMRHSPEFWLLATVVVDRLSPPGARTEPSTSSGNAISGMKHAAGPLLAEYDQTSMRQVNDLIAKFQKVQIG